jgi:hypothetical protein
MRQGGVIDEPIAVLFELVRHFGRSTGVRAILQAWGSLLGKALHPFAQGGIGKVEGLGDGLDVLARDHLPDGLRTAQDAGVLGLLEHGVSGRQHLSREVAFEGTHRFAPEGL